ncbi:MAG TPA: chorismate-binding protein [Cyanobacteria bacterium UBA11149]|nr:chorismate-binding protein [Cyanobacteria bacterium UBA11367]HBE57249.1 chorismate-binding protein [Cyanobacteria bacterium UBA11366]HBR73626.1 chorismate-binding protein [Cyanobacteria bacterium UBA11159]HBS69185.1 chorismate-binding protein [Cyanobacteria bacterium UBA11153]HBW91101.1 chorismate-binding protein [Cyanobacteria bacterium UBA11149]HCA96566.1 chorismate-binding protein [Cyanobacteria bacterium UBA9226]
MIDRNLVLTLARWIAGDFSNQKQAFADGRNYAHIRLFFRPLPWDFFSGIGFYSEQVYNHDLWTPYRQGVHRFVEQEGQVYVENYGLKDRIRYAGAGRELDILKTITLNCIERRYNCSMVFQWEGNLFRGRVEGNSCLIEKYGKQTYLVSDVELTETTFVTLDRGIDVTTQQQVWGSTVGPLRFEKRSCYASEVPLMPPLE